MCIHVIKTGEREGRFHWLQITETLSSNLCKIVVTDIRPAEIISPCPITRSVYLWNQCRLFCRRVGCTRPRRPGRGPRRASPGPRPRDSCRGESEGGGGVVFVCIWILIGVAGGVHPSGFQDYCQNLLARVSLNMREIYRDIRENKWEWEKEKVREGERESQRKRNTVRKIETIRKRETVKH